MNSATEISASAGVAMRSQSHISLPSMIRQAHYVAPMGVVRPPQIHSQKTRALQYMDEAARRGNVPGGNLESPHNGSREGSVPKRWADADRLCETAKENSEIKSS